jgi:hypothetical protein
MENLLKKLEDLLNGKTALTIKISFNLEAQKELPKELKTEEKLKEEKIKEKKVPAKGSAPVREFDATISDVKPDPANVGEQSIKGKIEEVSAATEDDFSTTTATSQAKPELKEGEEYCKACQGTGKNSKGGVCVPCDGTGVKKKLPDEAVKAAKGTGKNVPDKEVAKEEKKDDADEWDF